MQIHRLSYQVKGFVRITDYALRFAYMVTDQAKEKARILNFWQKYGLTATTEAFKIKERTLYYWQAKLKKGNGQLEALNGGSKAPKNKRLRLWPEPIKQKIKDLRTEHPNLSKEKIHPFLLVHCQENNLTCPSVSTIGNLIRDMGGLRTFSQRVSHFGKVKLLKRAKVLRKPRNFQALYPGHCGSFDTVEKIIQGCRRYVLTFTDVYSRFSLAWSTTSHASLAVKEFFNLVTFLFPYPLAYALTDNGSEFKKHFNEELIRLHVAYYHTYPKTPKMNAHCERFNMSLQEEYLDYHQSELLLPEKFNVGLMKYLLWYNTERPHFGLKLQTPVNFITNSSPDCKMYLTNTVAGIFPFDLL